MGFSFVLLNYDYDYDGNILSIQHKLDFVGKSTYCYSYHKCGVVITYNYFFVYGLEQSVFKEMIVSQSNVT